jgi:hypothetical protein
VPIEEFPSLDELIWLFEAQPVLDDDVGWPVSPATFETTRDDWKVSVYVDPYGYSVGLFAEHQGARVLELSLYGMVETVTIERRQGREGLNVYPMESANLQPLHLTLKPRVSVTFGTKPAWQR